MLFKLKLKGISVFPSNITAELAYKKNLVLIIRAINGKRALYVDYVPSDEQLGSYKLPVFLQGKLVYYEVIDIPEEYSSFIKCIAGEVQRKVFPLYENKKLSCNNEITVVIENEN
ncbi:hypothetical protein DFR86_03885 [Acidianus sulfidivorans JP7]|uniref:Uncharacterized protein n=1 Tax=Acidianus sulfidivorans JP7 TaxID=619593 RepID=A0A2U9IL94_9CREN|nr:hypothetical protein [Acidianus sulfidivorans]AWR96780.1 hypothetical protein DFR86_03885 [Acidianus sulfidivorans JP7]